MASGAGLRLVTPLVVVLNSHEFSKRRVGGAMFSHQALKDLADTCIRRIAFVFVCYVALLAGTIYFIN
jgi:hypothetical protein